VSTQAATAGSGTLDLVPLIAGRLLDDFGGAAVGIQVEVFKQVPSDGAVALSDGVTAPADLDLDPVGTVTTDANGFFLLKIPAITPGSNYELQAEVGGQPIIYDFSPTINGLIGGVLQLLTPAVAVVNSLTGALSDPASYLGQLGSLIPGPILNLIGNLIGDGGNTVVGPPDGWTPPDDDSGDAASAGAPAAMRTSALQADATAASTSCVPGWTKVWHVIPGSDFKKYLPVHSTWTGPKSTQLYNYFTGTKTKVGVVVDAAGHGMAGGMQAGLEKGASGDAHFDMATNRYNTQFVEWGFVKYRQYCHYLRGNLETRTDVTKSVATSWLGGSWPKDKVGGAKFFSGCSNGHRIGTPTHMTQSTSTTFSGWVNIGGIGVDTSQTQSSQTDLTVTPRGGSPWYCSSSPSMFTSSQVHEDETHP